MDAEEIARKVGHICPIEGVLDWFQNLYSNRIDIMTRVIKEQCC